MLDNDEMIGSSVGRLLIKLSFPPMAGMVVYSTLCLIDILFVSRLGSVSLAAITITVPIQVLMAAITSATGIGVTSLIARTLGKGDSRLADNIAWHGLTIALLYGLLFSYIGSRYIDNILIFCGCTPEIFGLSKGFMTIIFAGCIFNFIPMMLCNIIQGEGNTFLPMVIALLEIGLNVLLDPILMFGWGAVPAMGLNGAALATVMAQVITSLAAIGIVCRRRCFLSWSRQHFHPGFKVILEIYRVGIPAIIMEIVGVAIMTFINRTLAGYGYAAIAALGIFLRVRSLLCMPVYGLTRGTMPIAAFAYGAGNYERVKEVIVKASVLAFIYITAVWLILHRYALWIADFFSNDPALTVMTVSCIHLAALFLPVIGPLLILYTVFQALGKGVTAMILSVLRQAGFFLPLLIVMPCYYKLDGVWLAFSFAEACSAFPGILFLIILWRELQGKLAVVLLLQKGYAWKRFWAWLRWQ